MAKNKIKQNKERTYYFDTTLKFTDAITAESRSGAIQILKESFADSFNIEVGDKEIKYTGYENID